MWGNRDTRALPFLSILMLLGCGLMITGEGAAELRVRSKSLQTDYLMALQTDDSSLALQRATVRPAIRLSAGRKWQFSGALRIEYGGSDTGLGTRDTYDPLSRPLSFGSEVRIEIDKATATWRQRRTQFILGKQTVAWGILDGLRVTDRFDPVRLRDAYFTEYRPERLSRWGARARFEHWGANFDLAATFDGTVNQNAEPGTVFFPRASRLRGGLPDGSPIPNIIVDRPSSPTLGLRVSRTLGSSQWGVLAIHGPDTDPVFAAADQGVALLYPNRTLLGATWESTAGSRVWRFEAAYVPDQALNLAGPNQLQRVSQKRWLAGAGLDWKLPKNLFLNMQVGVDHIASTRHELTRPRRDVIATVRGHKDFANATLRVSAELLTSLSDGDYALRPQLAWQVNDRLRLATGADFIRGNVEDLLGQFENASRVWIGARLSY